MKEMRVQTCICTDVGIKKSVNQDAAMVKVADTDQYGKVILAVLCDGMGGLSCGEVASAAFVKRMESWFMQELPQILTGEGVTQPLTRDMAQDRDPLDMIRRQWKLITGEMNDRIAAYGTERGIKLGTTAVCLLTIGLKYLVMNVGDSRVYMADAQAAYILTHDQSYVQQQMDIGVMTPAQAERSDQKNVLLQCIGASETVTPEFESGPVKQSTVFMLCCDGYWRKQSRQELFDQMRPGYCSSEQEMNRRMLGYIETVKSRQETDNISVIQIAIMIKD